MKPTTPLPLQGSQLHQPHRHCLLFKIPVKFVIFVESYQNKLFPVERVHEKEVNGKVSTQVAYFLVLVFRSRL